jgi:glycosyltransferase A (GT-A) superfamily protein (DUF2064 family)
MAKEPMAGRVKTRLCPPCELAEAADLAAAALCDTLDAALSSGAERVVLALDGRPGEWCPPGVEVVTQVDGGFDARLAAAWEVAGGPGVQIGMDTPQLTARHLDGALATMSDDRFDATLGPAEDGGWWLIGLRRPDARVFAGLPMSRPDTGRLQRERLDLLGLRCGTEPPLRDVDHIADALAAAEAAPQTRFARRLARISASWDAPTSQDAVVARPDCVLVDTGAR